MIYLELTFILNPIEPFSEILMSELADIGFESFVETETGFQAYIPQNLFDENQLKQIDTWIEKPCEISYEIKQIEEENWNAVWESNYEPVYVDNICSIRAPFHPENPNTQYEIVIEPKMSFGTGHHETTSSVIRLLAETEIAGKSVMDMGCGTGILAIFAAMKGASSVEAVDNDPWSYENTLENIERNGHPEIKAALGDASYLGNTKYDIFIANINRNILLRDMESYIKCINDKGLLLMSGFYTEDIPAIRTEAEKWGMNFINFIEKNNWVAIKFLK